MHRQTRRRYSPQARIRIVLEGLRGEARIAGRYRKGDQSESIVPLAKVSRGRRSVRLEIQCEAAFDEVKSLRTETARLEGRGDSATDAEPAA